MTSADNDHQGVIAIILCCKSFMSNRTMLV